MRSLVILCDTVRRDFLSAYGNGWVHTPNLDRLADRSVVYDNHYVGSLPCMPARRDIFTGRQHFLHCGWGGLEPYDASLARLLRNKANVFSHICTDHYHYFHRGGENYVDEFSSWAFQRGQENDCWVSAVDRPALPESPAPTKMNVQNLLNRERQQHEEDYSGPRTVRDALEWLDRNAREDDWYLHLELFDPHEPFMVPEEYARLYEDDYEGELWDWPAYAPCGESPEQITHMRKRYAALLTMTDRWLGRVLDALEQHGVFDDTMIVFTTDHGTCLSEHGYWMKNYFPVFQELAHIPLFVHYPDSDGAGTRCQALTQTHDLFKTLCEHHQMTDLPEHVMGVSLQDAYKGRSDREAMMFGYFGAAVNVTDGRYVYMRNPVHEDNGPLNMYTSLPCSGRLIADKSVYADVTCDRFFSYTDGLPMFKVPLDVSGANRYVREEAGGCGHHQLWDTLADSGQEHSLSEPDTEKNMLQHLERLMTAAEAPSEQWARLGLKQTARS